jgi:hypothetical protein
VTEKELAAKAEEMGVHLTKTPCSSCGGSGHFLRPDPLDLKLLRERYVSKNRFAVWAGVSISYIHKIENPDPEKGAPCSAKLLEKYLAIPTHDWNKKRSSALYARLATMPLEERQEYIRRALAKREELAKRRAANPVVKAGQVWERAEGGKRQPAVRVLHVEGGSAMVQAYRDEKAKPRSISLHTLRKHYVCVSGKKRAA